MWRVEARYGEIWQDMVRQSLLWAGEHRVGMGSGIRLGIAVGQVHAHDVRVGHLSHDIEIGTKRMANVDVIEGRSSLCVVRELDAPSAFVPHHPPNWPAPTTRAGAADLGRAS